MNKTDIINQIIFKNGGKQRRLIINLFNEFVDTIRDQIQDGNSVTLTGLGTFKCNKMKARKARNPKTGETVYLDNHTKLQFKPSTKLKEHLKNIK